MFIFRYVARKIKGLPDWFKIPVLIVEFTILAMLVFWLYLTRTASVVEVPDIMGMPLENAEYKLAERGLSMRVKWEASIQTPEGEVINQVPGPKTEIKDNRPLTVYASKGIEYMEVPDLEGESLTDAQNFLHRLNAEREIVSVGLDHISWAHHERYPANQIMRQYPPPDSEVPVGTGINLLVSRGRWPRRQLVPVLEGLSKEEALEKIENSELQLGQIRHVRSPGYPYEAVLDQDPAPRVMVPYDQPILLTVNLGEPDDEILHRYTTLKINPPLSVTSGHLRVELDDSEGRRVIFDEKVAPGEKVEIFTGVYGIGQVAIYWNGELLRYRSLEAAG